MNREAVKNYNIKLDILRVFAAASVVFCHALQSVIRYSPVLFENCNCNEKAWALLMYFFIGRSGVPIFLILTGYLLFSRHYIERKVRFNFYSKNLLSLVFTWELWVIVYAVFSWYKMGNNVTGKSIILQILLISTPNYPNSWYMPMVIVLYITIPFLSMLILDKNKEIESTRKLFFLIVCLLLVDVVRTISYYKSDIIEYSESPLFSIYIFL